MGFGLPAAIGTAIALQDQKSSSNIYLLETDGSFNVNLQELSVLKSQELNIIILLNNNSGYMSIRNGQTNTFNGRISCVDNNTGLGSPNYKLLAEAYSLDYYLCNSSKDLEKFFEFLNSPDYIPMPTIVELKTSDSEILIPKCSPRRTNSGKIYSMPLEDMSPPLTMRRLETALRYTSVDKLSIAARDND